MGVKNILKKNWKVVLSVLIGIIATWIVAHYYYKQTIEKPAPVFILDPARTQIIDSKSFVETPLKIIRADGDEIKGDITSVRFYFWNMGRQSIKPENILEPITLNLIDPEGEILDFKILKTSRDIIEAKISRFRFEPERKLEISFRILEQNDGITGQLIFSGNSNSNIEIKGTVERSKRIITKNELRSKQFWKAIFQKIIKGLAIILALILVIEIIKRVTYLYKKSESILEKTTSKYRKFLWKSIQIYITGSLGVIFLAILIAGLIVGPIREAKEKAETNITEIVPKEIIP